LLLSATVSPIIEAILPGDGTSSHILMDKIWLSADQRSEASAIWQAVLITSSIQDEFQS
jgi:hypothetical protein